MERLKQIAKEMRSSSPRVTEQEIFNASREYLQTLVLKLIYQSKYGAALSFMGGTALRICYDLKRYSEDLDFALDNPKADPKAPYHFKTLAELLKKELSLLGYEVSLRVDEERIVQKAFLGFSGLPEALALKGFRKGQKLHIKLETDVRPPALNEGDRESFFVNRFQEIFPILKHTLPTMFAGKILAVLYRAYTRGRDYYDLIWYMTRKTGINLDYLNRGAQGEKFASERDVFSRLGKKIESVDPETVLKDIDRFLEDPKESAWLSRFPEVFNQLAQERLK